VCPDTLLVPFSSTDPPLTIYNSLDKINKKCKVYGYFWRKKSGEEISMK
jgi:hypothetical protein